MDSLAIEFAPGALNAIKVQVIRGCKPAALGHPEVGGLLCGTIVEYATSTVVRIDSVIQVPLEPRADRASHLSNTDKWYLSKAIQDFASRPVIGWYRSQTQPNDATPESRGVILEEDRSSSAEFFPKRKTAFLICYPDKDLNLPGRLCLWTAGKAEVVTAVSLGPCAPVLSQEQSSRPARYRPDLKAMAETFRATVSSLWPRNARVLTFAQINRARINHARINHARFNHSRIGAAQTGQSWHEGLPHGKRDFFELEPVCGGGPPGRQRELDHCGRRAQTEAAAESE